MAWKFLSIGKANQEIERLRAENEQLTKQKEAAANPPATAAAVEEIPCEPCNHTGKCAECGGSGKVTAESLAHCDGPLAKANAALDEANATNASLSDSLEKANAALAAKDSEISRLREEIKAKDGEVKIKVAAALVNEQARLGQPPLPNPPTEGADPAKTQNTITGSNGKEVAPGRPRILAACREALDSVGYKRKQN